MLKAKNFQTYGWESAIRGMRNPMNSWEKSDSHYCQIGVSCDKLNLHVLTQSIAFMLDMLTSTS